MAFADDLVIMAKDEESGKRLLESTDSLKKKGMAINGKKSKCLSTIVQY